MGVGTIINQHISLSISIRELKRDEASILENGDISLSISIRELKLIRRFEN